MVLRRSPDGLLSVTLHHCSDLVCVTGSMHFCMEFLVCSSFLQSSMTGLQLLKQMITLAILNYTVPLNWFSKGTIYLDLSYACTTGSH